MSLNGKTIAILIAEAELPNAIQRATKRLRTVGGQVRLLAPRSALDGLSEMAVAQDEAEIKTIEEALTSGEESAESAATFNVRPIDGLMLIGGQRYAEVLAASDIAVQSVREFFKLAKPVAALGYGVQILMAADVIHERKITSPQELRKDCEEMGATWVDQSCVCEQGLVTSGSEAHLDTFLAKAIEEFSEGTHVGQTV